MTRFLLALLLLAAAPAAHSQVAVQTLAQPDDGVLILSKLAGFEWRTNEATGRMEACVRMTETRGVVVNTHGCAVYGSLQDRLARSYPTARLTRWECACVVTGRLVCTPTLALYYVLPQVDSESRAPVGHGGASSGRRACREGAPLGA